MKLVFPAAEHPQVLLGTGIHRIGSAREAQIVLDGPGILPAHCDIYLGQHGVVLRPCDEAKVEINGRVVDGLIAVRPGDVISFGDQIQARLEAMQATTAPAAPADSAELSRSAASTPAQTEHREVIATRVQPVLPKFVLRGISSAGFGRTFPLAGPTVVGRDADCQIRLDQPGLSRHHARLTPTGEGVLVEDMGSTNGTLINEARIMRGVAHHGDEIGFDMMRFRLVASGMPDVEPAPRTAQKRPASPPPTSGSNWLLPAAIGFALLVAVLLWLL